MVHLNIGDRAPDFSLYNQDGKLVSLADFKGRKLVIYFYPKDNTPSCTAQACNLRDHLDMIEKSGYKVLGVSNDSQKSHQNFIKKYALNFELLSDPELKMINAYGVWGQKSMFGHTFMGTMRTTFKIDEKGVITSIISKVNTKNHVEQLL
ncbi:MAG TPA: thioredoxin-dependent thiol peroxidase [Cytophagales bacterium]|nr:thioredoxin-dependent thiol peroxidase [Cytophagales bacterium]